MDSKEFENRIAELLPEANEAATQSWIMYANELDAVGAEQTEVFFTDLFIELSLASEHYGKEIALQLFDLGTSFTLNPFEVRGAAKHLRDGGAESEIEKLAVDGYFFTDTEEMQEYQNAKEAFVQTLPVNKDTAQAINGEINVGNWAIVAPYDIDFGNFVGKVTAIDRDGSAEHGADNFPGDVHLNFFTARYPPWLTSSIVDVFSEYYSEVKDFNELPLGDVTISADRIISLKGIDAKTFNDLIIDYDYAEEFCNEVMSEYGIEPREPTESRFTAYSDRVDNLLDRIEQNYADFRQSLDVFTGTELIDMASEIHAWSSAWSYLSSHNDFSDEELQFYEQFDNPLKTVANALRERNISFEDISAQENPDKNLPDSEKTQIEYTARPLDVTVSVTQDMKVFAPEYDEAARHDLADIEDDDLRAERRAELYDKLHGEKPEVTPPGYPLPDPDWTVAEMNEYGYTADDMLPLSAGVAVKLFDSDHTIYLLYSDNSEALAFDRDEIIAFSKEGFCGITKADWEMSPEYKAQTAIAANSEAGRESDLLHAPVGKFGIYQIRGDIDEPRNYRSAPMRELEALGLTVDRANYELVYVGDLTIRDTQTNLHRLYDVFQRGNGVYDCPADFTGRSVTIGDVIVLQWNGEVSAHFVDSADFTELPAFTGNERTNEPQAAQTLSQVGSGDETAPSYAELEADVKAGKSISVADLAKAINAVNNPPIPKVKPSLHARLEENKKKAARTAAETDAPKTKQREV
jgi:hypothetical protein